MPQRSGLASAGALAMVLVGIVSGAVVGLILANATPGPAWLAIITAFMAAILAFATGHAVVVSAHLPRVWIRLERARTGPVGPV